MGFMSRKVLPVCGNMCVCCPALRTRSRQPVKRYKKLLAEIFPKSPDGSPNERKIVKLCEYAAKNPFRIPKIAKHLEQRIYKELRNEHIKIITVAMEAYNKFLSMCKQQMPYYAASLLNVVVELLDNTKQDNLRILGCQTLTRFIYSQADGTYAHNIEVLVPKVCTIAREAGEEPSKRCLRASGLQCISSMVWFMSEFSHICTGFDEIVHVILDNYEPDTRVMDDAESGEAHHNWVAEVVRSETRGAPGAVSPSYMIIRARPERKDLSLLTREEIETPKVWAQICVQKMAELAKESTTMRRVLDPIFIYFDIRRHWVPREGLAMNFVLGPAHCGSLNIVLFSFLPGSEHSILSSIIRHLDHKNVAHDPQVKSNIICIAATLAHQFRSIAVAVESGIVDDLCRHLRKSLQATFALTGEKENNLNVLLQNSIKDCLLEIIKGVGDAQPLFDMMAITLEKPIPVGVAASATVGSMLILAYIISSATSSSHSQQAIPEALLLQLLKTMIHRDVEARIVAHQIFSVLLVPTCDYPRHESVSINSGYPYEPKRSQSKSAPGFASARVLLEKLRREKDGLKVERHGNDPQYDFKEKGTLREEWRQGWVQNNSSNVYKISSTIDRTAGSTVSTGKIPNENVVHFLQLPLSLRDISLDPNNGMLPPSCQRSLFVLATAMLMSTAKFYCIPDLLEFLTSVSCDVDPYLGIGDDQQLYVKPQADVKEYGSTTDHQAALYSLTELREGLLDSDKVILDILVRSLSSVMELDMGQLATQLSEAFRPDDGFLFGPPPWHKGDHLQSLSIPKESLSFDGDFSAIGTIEDDAVSESSVADLSCFIPKISTSPAPSHVISVGQLLESTLEKAGQAAGTAVSTSPLPYSAMTRQCEVLGTCTRKTLSNWLDHGAHDSKSADKLLLTLPSDGRSVIRKISSDIGPRQEGGLSTEPWSAMRLPPASPFDNFLRAVNRQGAIMSPSSFCKS
ncbi:hypothetical protein IFM89_009559 [Coptis chinensis]|uniref:Uncharacterized protein n=1 Tax=Coptis chinensis TaxID=261450 RepID=A0A835M4Z1_9MAGN|nr:hypothetical protein IFM89_009559 [Coptis chinensis]